MLFYNPREFFCGILRILVGELDTLKGFFENLIKYNNHASLY